MKSLIKAFVIVVLLYALSAGSFQKIRCTNMSLGDVAKSVFSLDWANCDDDHQLPPVFLPNEFEPCEAWLKFEEIKNYPPYLMYSYPADLYLVDTCK